MKQGGGYAVDDLQQRIFLQRHKNTEQHSPEDEVPTGTMPHPSEEPHHQDVDGLMTTVTSHRDIDIVSEETTQGNMPSSPEFRDGLAAVWMVEVLVESESQASSKTDCHVGIAREVEIDL